MPRLFWGGYYLCWIKLFLIQLLTHTKYVNNTKNCRIRINSHVEELYPCDNTHEDMINKQTNNKASPSFQVAKTKTMSATKKTNQTVNAKQITYKWEVLNIYLRMSNWAHHLLRYQSWRNINNNTWLYCRNRCRTVETQAQYETTNFSAKKNKSLPW